MSISSEVRRAGPYSGNGSTTAFAFAFKVFTTAQVLVTRTVSGVETTLTLTTHYTVSLNANQNTNPGGTVTMLTAPVVGQSITITSNVANLQPTAIANLGGFYPEVINDSLDRATIQIQQLDERLDRALVIPVSSSGVSTQLPAPEINKVLGWNGTGTAVINYTTLPPSGEIYPVATYAALTATPVANLQDDMLFYVASRSTDGDGGHGVWRYDSASTATADASTILARDGGGAGRFFRLDGPELQSSWVGVANDGSTNNTTTLAALNTQLDGLTYQKEVLFPAGVTSAATWPNFDIRYVNFTAAGDARLRNTGTGDTFQINAGGGTTEDYFYGTRIQGPLGIEGASGSGRGVIFNGIQRSLFQQFHVLGCGTDDDAIRIEHGVCLCTINFAASQFFRHPNPPGWYDNAQPQRGLVITKRSFNNQQSGHNLHINLMMEGISEDGILLDYCVGENFIAGTSESNLHATLSRGFRSTANCFGHRVFSLDVEGISSAIDFDVTAASGELVGIHAEDAVVVRNGAEDTYISGGDVDALHVETGATDTTIIGTRFRRYTQAVGLSVGTNTTKILTPAFVYSVSGVSYPKATAETTPGNDVIPVGTYGAVALDIGTDGVIDAVEATNNATGYASSALAAAGLPAVAGSHVRIGYVTAMKSDGAFTFGTTALNAANTTVAYSGELLVTLLDDGTRTWIIGAIDTTNNRRVHKTFSFSAHRNSSNQTGITTATFTKFAPTTEVWDYGAAFDSTTNYRWTPPLVGVVRVTATLWLSGLSAGSEALIAVYKNGSLLRYGTRVITAADGIAGIHVDAMDVSDGDDYYEVFFKGTENSANSIVVNGSPVLSFMQGHVA